METITDLAETILEHGIENILFMVDMRPIRKALMIAYTSSQDNPVFVPAHIVEERYKVKERYKITLQSTISGFGKETFYLNDLCCLIKQDSIKMYIRTK